MISVHPVRTEAELTAALAEYERLLDAHPEPGTPDFDRISVLGILIEAYESEHHPMEDPDDPIAVIEFFMEERGMTRADLEPYIGSRARVAEIMTGKRSLTLDMIRRLHAGLRIPADLLIGKPPALRPELRFTLQLPQGERRSVAAYVRGLLDAVGIGEGIGVRTSIVDTVRRRLILEAADRSLLEAAEEVIRAQLGPAVIAAEYIT